MPKEFTTPLEFTKAPRCQRIHNATGIHKCSPPLKKSQHHWNSQKYSAVKEFATPLEFTKVPL
jgi:hypothetical protein